MAELNDDKTTIKQLLEKIARIPSATGNVELETIFDDQQSRYQVVAQGWQGKKRTHGCLIHIDLKGEKVWLQHDSTDAEIAESLVERGIPKERIVLGGCPRTSRFQRHERIGDAFLFFRERTESHFLTITAAKQPFIQAFLPCSPLYAP